MISLSIAMMKQGLGEEKNKEREWKKFDHSITDAHLWL